MLSFVMKTSPAKILIVLLCAGMLFSCKSGTQGQQKTLAQGETEKVQLPEARLEQPVVLTVPESIKEIILEYISEDDLNNLDRWRIPENKRNYWEMWQSYLKFDVSGAFYNAVWTGNIRLVREMLYHHGDFMRSNGFADIAVARTQNLEMVRILLDAGFIFTGDDRRVRWDSEWMDRRKLYTALAIFAGQNDDSAVVQLLIDRGAELTDFAVYQAAWLGKCENLKVLLKAGGNARAQENDSHKNTALQRAAENGNAECVALLLDYGAAEDIEAVETWMGWTPLLWAVHSGSAECVALLLNAGANPEAVGKYGDLALREAVQSGNERSVQLLLNSSAVNTINMISEHRPLNAIMEAAFGGRADILRMLIEKGGDVMGSGNIHILQDPNSMYHFTDLCTNEKEFSGDLSNRVPLGGQTALMLARTPECAEILLQSGADVNAQDSDGRNALLFQCYFSSDGEIVSLLINAGSYLYLDQDGGRSLLRIANDEGNWVRDWQRNEEAIALLKAAGCRDDDPNAEAKYSFHSYYAN
jgi:ankyrin repeat protein